jgi:hypothetical protein
MTRESRIAFFWRGKEKKKNKIEKAAHWHWKAGETRPIRLGSPSSK